MATWLPHKQSSALTVVTDFKSFMASEVVLVPYKAIRMTLVFQLVIPYLERNADERTGAIKILGNKCAAKWTYYPLTPVGVALKVK